jgi:hypothetical protein
MKWVEYKHEKQCFSCHPSKILAFGNFLNALRLAAEVATPDASSTGFEPVEVKLVNPMPEMTGKIIARTFNGS